MLSNQFDTCLLICMLLIKMHAAQSMLKQYCSSASPSVCEKISKGSLQDALPGSRKRATQMIRWSVGQLHALRRYKTSSELAQLGSGNLQEALQKVNADLEEANRELHDLREVHSNSVLCQASVQIAYTAYDCLFMWLIPCYQYCSPLLS